MSMEDSKQVSDDDEVPHEYIIQEKDTLMKIALKFGVKYAFDSSKVKLKKMNNIHEDFLIPGTVNLVTLENNHSTLRREWRCLQEQGRKR